MINNGIHTEYNITVNSIIVLFILYGVHFRENIFPYNGRIMCMSRSPSARGREYVLLPLHNTFEGLHICIFGNTAFLFFILGNKISSVPAVQSVLTPRNVLEHV